MRKLAIALVLFTAGCASTCETKDKIIVSMKKTLQSSLKDYESGNVKISEAAVQSRILRIKGDIIAAEEVEKGE